MKHFLLFGAITFLIASCGNQTPKSPGTDSAIPFSSSELTLQEKQSKARFIVDSYEDTALATPHSKISVEYNDSRTFLADIPGIAEIQQGGNESMEIPNNAVTSCGCWWAGGGDYYYLAPSEKGITVFHGWLDEMQEDEGYHWEEMKSIE